MNKEQLYCNGCGKKISVCHDIVQEGILDINWDWGYFSEKDGENHSFCLCEACYDKMCSAFVIPVQVRRYLPFSGSVDEQ